MINIIIYEEPKSKGRPVFSTKGGKLRAYTSKKTSSYENTIKKKAKEVIPVPMECAVGIHIKFYLHRPKRLYWKDKEMPAIHCTKRPDLDNLSKAIVDGLNGVAFKDDRQIVNMHSEKYYHSGNNKSRIEISIWKEEDLK